MREIAIVLAIAGLLLALCFALKNEMLKPKPKYLITHGGAFGREYRVKSYTINNNQLTLVDIQNDTVLLYGCFRIEKY